MKYRGSILIALALLVLIVFGRSIYFDFVGFDDFLHIVENPNFHPVSLEHVGNLWRMPYRSVYMPVTYSFWAVIAKYAELPVPDAQGLTFDPYLFHALSVLLHLINVALVWLIVRRFIRNPWAAATGAAIFAVHPLQVESVAWVSSMKDLLGGTFSLIAINCYFNFVDGKPGRWLYYALAFFAFGLAMLSKATSIVTPLMILILLIHQRRSWKPLVPWIAIVAPFVFLTRHFQEDAALLIWSPMWARPLEALDAIAFYLWKICWPLGLVVDYSRDPTWLMAHPVAWLLWILPVIIASLFWWKRRSFPEGVTGGLLFVAGLLPVSGFIVFEFQGFSTVADRYVYLPMLGVAVAVGGLIQHARRGGWIIAGVVIVSLSALAFRQVGFWQNSVTLFDHAIAVEPEGGFGWSGMAGFRAANGDLPGAADAYRHALRVRPHDVQALSGLAEVLRLQGPSPEATQAYAAFAQEAARVVLLKYPDSPVALRKMADALALEGRSAESAWEFEHALRVDPSDVAAHMEYAEMLESAGQFPQSVEQYQAALQLSPQNPGILQRLQRVEAKMNPSTRPK